MVLRLEDCLAFPVLLGMVVVLKVLSVDPCLVSLGLFVLKSVSFFSCGVGCLIACFVVCYAVGCVFIGLFCVLCILRFARFLFLLPLVLGSFC